MSKQEMFLNAFVMAVILTSAILIFAREIMQ